MNTTLHQSQIKSLPLISQGKVRDMYAVNDDLLLIVASDRISAFDVILDDPIPGKGQVLTQLTNFWLKYFNDLVPTHATNIQAEEVVAANEVDQVKGRAVVVKRLKPILIEAVARGYIIGSGWKDYQQTGAICGVELPAGLQQAQQLDAPIFTPAAKAAVGDHDENISFTQAEKLIGSTLANQIRDLTLSLYQKAARYAKTKGIIIADTKFEFGLDNEGVVHLMDEVLTPDSSRFWPADSYQVGTSPASYDKQFVRDWLEQQEWDKTAPAPRLPQDIIQKTADKYQEALTRLMA